MTNNITQINMEKFVSRHGNECVILQINAITKQSFTVYETSPCHLFRSHGSKTSITRDTYLSEIAVELLQVEKCQPDANGVHAYPERVKHVMPEGSSD